MAYIQWSPELDTGIAVIDEQHKRIVQYINELQGAQEKLDKKAAGDVIDELVDYTISHFAFEESLMEQAGYPYISPHKKVHSLFINKISKFVERFKAGEDVTDDLLNMLQRWLINHIKSEDGDYAATVRENISRERGGSWFSKSLRRVFG